MPYFGGLVVFSIFQKMDILLLKNFSDNHELGLYASALQLLNSTMIAFSMILCMSISPSFIYAIKEEYLIKRNTLIMTSIMFAFSIVIAIFCSLLAPIVMPVLFGSEFKAAVPLLIYLFFAGCLVYIENGLNVFLIKLNRGNLIVYKWVIAGGIALPVYYFAIQKYGSYGAIIGYATGYGIACIYGLAILALWKRKIGN